MDKFHTILDGFEKGIMDNITQVMTDQFKNLKGYADDYYWTGVIHGLSSIGMSREQVREHIVEMGCNKFVAQSLCEKE